MEAKWSFHTFKKRLSDWFGPMYKCKVSTYMLLHITLHLGLNLNCFSWFCCKFCTFRIILIIAYSYFLCLRINKPNIQKNFCFKNKVIEVSHMEKYIL